MSSHDNSNKSDRASINSPEIKNKSRPSLFPLRNSAKRKTQLLESKNIFNPHQSLRLSSKTHDQVQLGSKEIEFENDNDSSFEFKSPAQQDLMSLHTPRSSTTSRRVPKQFEFDTPYVPFVHQSLPRHTWESRSTILQEGDYQPQKKITETTQQQNQQISHSKQQQQDFEQKKSPKKDQKFIIPLKNDDISSDCPNILSTNNQEIIIDQYNHRIIQFEQPQNHQHNKNYQNAETNTPLHPSFSLKQCHSLKISPTKKNLSQYKTSSIQIEPKTITKQNCQTNTHKIQIFNSQCQTINKEKLQIYSKQNNFTKNNIYIPINSESYGQQIYKNHSYNFQIFNICVVGPKKQLKSIGVQYQSQNQEIGVQINMKSKLSIQRQQISQYSVKYDYDKYLEEKFDRFMELMEIKFRKQKQKELERQKQRILSKQADNQAKAHAQPDMIDASSQYDQKETKPRPSIKRVSIIQKKSEYSQSFSTESVVNDQAIQVKPKKEQEEEKEKEEEKSKKKIQKRNSKSKQTDFGRHGSSSSEEFIPKGIKKSRKKAGKTPSRKKSKK